jgi:hypothetical protein
MFGLWFSIYGLTFGTICSVLAKSKNRNPINWYTIGIFFGIIGLIALAVFPKLERNVLEHYYQQ